MGFGTFLRWQGAFFWFSLILAAALTTWGVLAMR
jgi:hypothetical protein